MELDIPPFTFKDCSLEPEPDALRRRADSAAHALPQRLDGWLSLAAPIAVPMTPDKVRQDPLLMDFIQQQPAWRFYVVSMACSFKPPKDGHFDDAFVQIQLHAADDNAIAWSMEPERIAEKSTLTQTIKTDANLKFMGAELGGGTQCNLERPIQQIHVQALGVGTHQPLWEFIPSEHQPIYGIYRLSLVVRAPSSGCTLTSHLTANVQRYSIFNLFRYQTGVQHAASMEINLQ